MSAVDDLRGVARIAKAASGGVSGNTPRIERAEQAITAVAELLAAAEPATQIVMGSLTDEEMKRLRAALAACKAGGK